ALDSLIRALQNRQLDAPPEWKEVFARLLKDRDTEVQRLARRLAINFQDAAAIKAALMAAADTGKPPRERLDAVRAMALAHPAEALSLLHDLVLKEKDLELRCEACRALSSYDRPDIAAKVLAGWKGYPPQLRIEAVNLLAGRKNWAGDLLAAVGRKDVPRTDLTDNTILRIHAFKDKKLIDQIEKVWGRFRTTPADLAALIDKTRAGLGETRASFGRGKLVFENQCAKCHKFEGRGHDVGPSLDGGARDIEYLLVNVLDPNRVV